MRFFVRRFLAAGLLALFAAAAAVAPGAATATAAAVPPATATAVPPAATTDPFWDVSDLLSAARESTVGIVISRTLPYGDHAERLSPATGFIYAPGWVLTDAALLSGATGIRVLMPDGRVLTADPAKDVLQDTTTGVALVRVPTAGYPPLPPGDSDQVQVGHRVMAVGNPLGLRLGNSVSVGVISGLGRDGSASTSRSWAGDVPLIQTDAALNSGNWGGPLLNAAGQVIGVNRFKLVGEELEGLGFATPINVVRAAADALLAGTPLRYPWLGLYLEESPETAAGLPGAEGLRVLQRHPTSPSTRAQPGDRLMALDETPVRGLADLSAYLAGWQPGEQVTLTLKRGTETLTETVTLAERPMLAELPAATNVWVDMTLEGIEEAALFAARDQGQAFKQALSGYTVQSPEATAVLVTEFLYLGHGLQSRWAAGIAETPEHLVFEWAGLAAGSWHVAVALAGRPAEAAVGWTATLSQGGRSVPGRPGQLAGSPAVLGLAEPTLVFRFPARSLDPTQPLTFTLRDAEGNLVTQASWDLSLLR